MAEKEIEYLKKKYKEFSIHGYKTGYHNYAIKEAIGKQIEILKEA